MAKKQTGGSKQSQRGTKNALIEWTGGIIRLPVTVTEDGESFHPEVLVWMEEALVMGSEVTPPGEALSFAHQSLEQTIHAPMVGKPRKPTRLRVASEALAEVLRAEFAWLEVVVGATPMLDATAQEMAAHLEEVEASMEYSLPPLCSEMDAAMVGSYFDGAAALFRADPSRVIAQEGVIVSVSIPDLGIHEGVMSVGLQEGCTRLVLFESVESFVDFLEFDGEPEATDFRSVSLGFETKHCIPEETAQEIANRGWDIAAEDAYPEWFVLDVEDMGDAPSPEQMKALDAATRALTQMLAEPELATAVATETPMSRSFLVATHDGTLTVELCAPMLPPPANLLHELAALDLDLDLDGGEDEEVRKELEALLFDEFQESPEGQSLHQIATVSVVGDLASRYFGATFATMNADEFHELLFDLVPRKVSIPPSEAKDVVAELHAFYRFLQRAYALPQAEECLSVLTPKTAEALEESLGNEALFDPAKWVIEEGRNQGYDVDSPEGVEEWLLKLREGTEEEQRASKPAKMSKAEAAKRKAKRKASRKARRKKR